MGLFSGLRAKKAQKQAPEAEIEPLSVRPTRRRPEAAAMDKPLRLDAADMRPVPAEKAAEAPQDANVWDMNADAAPAEPAPAAAEPAAPVQSSRSRRNRTRIIGFEKSSGEIVDLFDKQAAAAPKSHVQFPVGWLLVVDGPGLGHCFALFSGMAQIGRGDDQTVQLDFGDTAISRNNHAAVVFDDEEKKFVLGHGGKANIVRVNGKPVVSNVDLSEGDKIKIGETTLQLKVLCGPDFEWKTDTKPEDEEDDEDVAIA